MLETRRLPSWAYVALGTAILLLAASIELAMGRRIWGISGEPGIWSGDVLSSHNSQYMFDPYSFSHLTHGFAVYGLLWLVARRLPIAERAVMAVGIESLWEVIENTNFVINRYRAATISLHYYGDSVMNSMCDILTCMSAFAIAALLPPRVSIALVMVLEVLLALWNRDNVIFNVVMLVWPIDAIRVWQAQASAH